MTMSKRESRLASVFFFPNGMVAVCDQDGHQMPQFQGTRGEALQKMRGADLSGLCEVRGVSEQELRLCLEVADG